MKKLLVFVAFLFCSTQTWANTCAATATGNWNAAGTWTTCGGTFPGAGDTATIGTGFVVTVATSTTATVGTDGATGTVAVTVTGTGTLIINGTLNSRGDLQCQAAGSTCTVGAGGTLVLDATAGKQYKWISNNTGTTIANMNITGTAWTAGNFGTVNGSGGRGGTNGEIVPSDGGVLYGAVNFKYALLENLGDASNLAYRNFEFVSSRTDTMNHVVWLTCGTEEVDLEQAGINWNAVDIRGQVGGTGLFIENDTGPPSAVRSVQNLTAYSAANRGMVLGFSGVTFSNAVLYNSTISTTADFKNQTLNKIFFLGDDSGITSLISPLANGGGVIQNSVFLADYTNPHYIVDAGAGTLGPDVAWGNVFDGNNHTAGDNGDLVIPTGSWTEKANIAINVAGTLFTMLNSTGRMTALNNTVYNSAGGAIGETTGNASQMVYALNNLFVNGSAQHPDGFHQSSNFLTQTGWTMDYTGYFNMSGSNITHPILGNASYLGPASVQAWFGSGSFGDNGKGAHDITGDPQFVDNTRTVETYGGWASVQAAAKEMVTINGIDFNGASTTATTKSIDALLSYIRTGFTPTNPIYLKTGYDGTDIGATGGFAEREGGH